MQEQQIDLFGYNPAFKETFGIHPRQTKLIKGVQSKGGTRCWACGQHAQVYRRRLNAPMCRALILIYRYYQRVALSKSIHIEGYLKRCNTSSSTRGDVAKLRYWGLLKKCEDGKSRAGHYWLTGSGMSFVKGLMTAPEFIKLYNNKFWGFEGNEINIAQAIKNEFNYDELMRGE